jgi:hypothetical protein
MKRVGIQKEIQGVKPSSLRLGDEALVEGDLVLHLRYTLYLRRISEADAEA